MTRTKTSGALGLACVFGVACGGGAPPKTPVVVASAPLWTARPSLMGIDLTTIWGDGADVFAAGRGAAIAHSGDAGETFSYAPSGLAGVPRFRNFSGTSGAAVWLVGDDDAGAPVLLHSADHGASWAPRAFGDARDLRAVWAVDDQRVVLGGTGDLRCTENGGATWTRTLDDAGTIIGALWGTKVGDQVLYAAGERRDDDDAGVAAAPVDDGCDGGSRGVASQTSHGVLLRSLDGGLTWTPLGIETAGALTSLWGTPDGRVVVASGVHASLAWTYDHGAHWLSQSRASAPPEDDLSAVWVGPADASLFFATPSGLVRNVEFQCSGPLKLSFESLPSASDGARGVAAIWGPGSDDVWAVGPGGNVRHRP